MVVQNKFTTFASEIKNKCITAGPQGWHKRKIMKKNETRAMVGGAQTNSANNVMKVAAITAIAAMNPAGFTVNAKTLAPVVSGFAVAVSATQNSFGAEGLARVVDYAAHNLEVTAIGGWLDAESNLYYYDAVMIIETIEEARTLAARENQIAFFDLNKKNEHRI